MSLYGKGMLITYSETPPEVEEDFNEWYNREHIDERVWMPGFHRARRYVDANSNADIKYFATYETDKVEDLADPEYMELLNRIGEDVPYEIDELEEEISQYISAAYICTWKFLIKIISISNT